MKTTWSSLSPRRGRRAGGMLAGAALLFLVTAVAALALSGSGYDLSWWTVDGGGAVMEGGGYRLSGTAGQADAGPPLSGGEYTLRGGFWSGVASGGGGESYIYLPLVCRGD